MPGIRLNLSKGGLSTSFGSGGGQMTVGRHGVRSTVGLPGTGLYYTHKHGTKSRGAGRSRGDPAEEEYEEPLTGVDIVPQPGMVARWLMPAVHRAFLQALTYAIDGQNSEVYGLARKYGDADIQIPAGILALQAGEYERAVKHLERAVKKSGQIGRLFGEYLPDWQFNVALNDWLESPMPVNEDTVMFALAEAYHQLDEHGRAGEYATSLYLSDSESLAHRLVFARHRLRDAKDGAKITSAIVSACAGVENVGVAEATMLLYRAQVMNRQGMHEAAKDVCMDGLRKKKDRPVELLRSLRFEKARALQGMGSKANIRKANVEFQKLYAEDPHNELYAEAARKGTT